VVQLLVDPHIPPPVHNRARPRLAEHHKPYLEAEAAALPTVEPVWLRVADGGWNGGLGSPVEPPGSAPPPFFSGPGPVYYFDLGDSSWGCVEIRPGSCRVIEHAPVFFRRARGLRALPRPEWEGSIELLRKYINVSEQEFPLIVVWGSAALRPVGPYPILILMGEQGSAKSTTARVLRELIDPNTVDLKGPPSCPQDFMLQAHNTWILTYDNLSSMSAVFADNLCRTATGGGYSTRALYANDTETLFDVKRPTVINGIDDFVLRGDVADRALNPQMQPIPDTSRRRETELMAEFRRDRPKILGALFMAVANGLKMLPTVELPASPRMADFTEWGEAVVRGLGWPAGSFLEAYLANRRAACDSALDNCEVAAALKVMLDSVGDNWRGTATELLQVLIGHARRNATKTAQWPETPKELSTALRRIVPQLRIIGSDVNFGREGSNRIITITRINGSLGADGLRDGHSRA
jgi:hypothetical protein